MGAFGRYKVGAMWLSINSSRMTGNTVPLCMITLITACRFTLYLAGYSPISSTILCQLNLFPTSTRKACVTSEKDLIRPYIAYLMEQGNQPLLDSSVTSTGSCKLSRSLRNTQYGLNLKSPISMQPSTTYTIQTVSEISPTKTRMAI